MTRQGGPRDQAYDSVYTELDSPSKRPNQLRQVMVASLIGTTIEWYDFFLYGTAVALVFNRLSFPTLDPLAGTLSNDGLLGPNFRSSMRALTAPNTASAPKRRAASQA